jgi:hypothetical protein
VAAAEPDTRPLDAHGSVKRWSSTPTVVVGGTAHESGAVGSGSGIDAGSEPSTWMSEARPVAKPIEEADMSVSPRRRRKVRLALATQSFDAGGEPDVAIGRP